MSFNGAFSSLGNGVVIVLKIPHKIIYPQAIRLEFPCTNNEVHFKAGWEEDLEAIAHLR